ncbi:MAG: YgaP family membrane protein, partial [Streptosporangiaceae bacterium]
MHRNTGNTDRALRGVLAIGAVAGSAVVGFSSGWGIVLLVVAAVMVLTGASGFCPIYRLVGINTCGARGCGSAREDRLH